MIQFAVAFLIGLCVVPATCWLIFVYPNSDVSLKPAVWGLIVGVVLGAVGVGALLAWIAHDWPKD